MKLNLAPNVVPPQPPNLPLPDHVQRLMALNRSSGGLELSKALPGVDPAFSGSMVLLDDVVHVSDGSVSATGLKRTFLLSSPDGCTVDGCQISIDDAALRM